MVIAVCAFGLALHPEQRKVGTCLGSAAPTPVRAREAEEFIEAILEWEAREEIGESALGRFGELVEMVARPISDVRGTAAYRTHAVGVLARRTLEWAWDEYRRGE
jgi:CO/xanthine dehydrogenase FAD-binding subunit